MMQQMTDSKWCNNMNCFGDMSMMQNERLLRFEVHSFSVLHKKTAKKTKTKQQQQQQRPKMTEGNILISFLYLLLKTVLTNTIIKGWRWRKITALAVVKLKRRNNIGKEGFPDIPTQPSLHKSRSSFAVEYKPKKFVYCCLR